MNEQPDQPHGAVDKRHCRRCREPRPHTRLEVARDAPCYEGGTPHAHSLLAWVCDICGLESEMSAHAEAY